MAQTVVLHLPQREVRRLADADPLLYRDVALLACRHQRTALSYIGAMLGRSLRARLSEILLLMAEPQDDEGEGALAVHISQEDLAGPVGVSRQRLNRHLGALEREGMIRKTYGRIVITDAEGLERER